MRTLIVGDVHGCLAELRQLVDQFGFVVGQDRLIQVGDAINKGPDSLGVIQYLESLNAHMVLGNHEAKILQIWEKSPDQRSEKDKSKLDALKDPAYVVDQISKWPLWLVLPEVQTPHGMDSITVVHAGLEPGRSSLEEMGVRCLLSIRTWDGEGLILDRPSDPPWHDLVKWPGTVVFGHWALQGLLVKPGFVGLDTGCVYGGSLTGWCPEENRLYQVNSLQPKMGM